MAERHLLEPWSDGINGIIEIFQADDAGAPRLRLTRGLDLTDHFEVELDPELTARIVKALLPHVVDETHGHHHSPCQRDRDRVAVAEMVLAPIFEADARYEGEPF